VDAIYIDPPYNTGAKDWKYNNDYVEADDAYRHSKWLAMMERRLKLAKRLLNPDNSVLIVTIDEKEYLRLGLLLEQVFPESDIQMVSSVINQAGSSRPGAFARTDEYIYFVKCGGAVPQALPLADEWMTGKGNQRRMSLYWNELMRTGPGSAREDSPNLFYPIYLTPNSEKFHSVGEVLPLENERSDSTHPENVIVRWPIRSDGTEGRWRVSRESASQLIKNGYMRLGRPRGDKTTLQYLSRGEIKKIETGLFTIKGRRSDGAVEVDASNYTPKFLPGSQWNVRSHDSSANGAVLNKSLMPGRRFPFPKSLYAVEDALRFFVAEKSNATILDFFSGSGTTAHAVMRLNKQDGGQRQCISITNNEVSADEQKTLRNKGLRPGDPEWEALGICDYITKPRIRAAITGQTPEGEPIKGDYKFTDEFPMADGFEENAEFFTLTYEAPRPIAHNKSFSIIAPLLWLKAGARGKRIDKRCEDFAVADTYGVLFDLDFTAPFIAAMAKAEQCRMAFIVTDDDRGFQTVCGELPPDIEAVRLHESYLTNFTINTGRD